VAAGSVVKHLDVIENISAIILPGAVDLPLDPLSLQRLHST
jgi:hypothetical protein